MTTIRHLLIAGILVMACAPVRAQWGPPDTDPAEMADRQTRIMTDSLGLSPAQQKRIHTVLATYGLKFQEAREDSAGDWTALRQTMQDLSARQDEELRACLTSTQWDHWASIREKLRKDRRPGEPGHRRPASDQ